MKKKMLADARKVHDFLECPDIRKIDTNTDAAKSVSPLGSVEDCGHRELSPSEPGRGK